MKRTLPVILLIIHALRLSGQEPVRPGSFSGSFESTSQIYQKDTAINAMVPQDRAGSNNYLKLDYYFRKLSAGIQVESYLPSLAGYPVTLNQTSIINRYLKYTGEKFSLQAGDFYEQFGSGLIFRSWENRQIGINNAVEGINIQVYPSDFLKLKAVYGRQRKGFERAASNIRGFDAAIDLSKIKRRDPEKLMTTQLGFSYVTRYQEYTGPDEDFPSTVNAFSARMDISHSIFSLSGEYVFKTKDPQVENSYSETPGMGLLVNGSLAWNRAGMTLSFRSLKNMYFRGEREATGVMVPVNYIPALTRHHEYMVTNIYVYNPQPGGETGFQADAFLNVGKVSIKDSKYGSDINLNLSWFSGPGTSSGLISFGNDYFRDASIEWKKKWNKQLKTTLQVQYLYYNKSVIEGGLHDNITAGTVAFNTIYNFTETGSLHFELQHLYTENDLKNWAATLVEVSFAPKWSFFVSDLYNYGKTDIHYPNVGGYYSAGGSRFGLSYGRQRAGLYCLGGVCRYVPAATGLTITFITTFNQ